MNEKLGITVIVITHEMSVVKEICDKVAIMESGRVVETGEVFAVFAAPKKEVTRDFIRATLSTQKIEELIRIDNEVASLKPGELIVRISYVQRNVSEPLISIISRKFNLNLNIIFADIEMIQGAPIGGTVFIMHGERQDIKAAIEYLQEKNIEVEVLKDARVS